MKQIFVFGSNLAGRHGKGAALDALKHHNAIYGQGEGRQGNSYAIPTKNETLQTLPLKKIKIFIDVFLEYASWHPKLKFNVTRIGCGLAGYKDKDIGPMFANAPENCILPKKWNGFKLLFSKNNSFKSLREEFKPEVEPGPFAHWNKD